MKLRRIRKAGSHGEGLVVAAYSDLVGAFHAGVRLQCIDPVVQGSAASWMAVWGEYERLGRHSGIEFEFLIGEISNRRDAKFNMCGLELGIRHRNLQ